MSVKFFARSVLLILILSLSLFGCKEEDKKESSDDSNSNLSPRLQEIEEKGTLVVGTAITRPFEYYDDQGRLVGFDVDLLNTIFADVDVTIEWREIAFADLLPSLQNGSVDIVIAAMYIRPDREEAVDMSQPYLETGLVLVVNAAETEITGTDDLAGRTLGVKEGSTGAAYAQRLIDEQGIDIELRIYTDTLDSLDDLNNGLIDAVFNDYLNTLVYIQDHPNVQVQGEILDPAGLGISVQSGDTELLTFVNTRLAELQENGQTQALFEKWIAPQVSTE